MYKSLTPDTLGGLVNSDLGRFHYNNARNDLIAKGITNPTEAQVMQQFRDNIVAANNEKVHRNRKMNEMYKLQQESASRMAAARASRAEQPQQPFQYSFRIDVNRNALTSITGEHPAEYSDATLQKVRDIQIENGKRISKATNGHSHTSKGIQMFADTYMKPQYREVDITNFLGYEKVKGSAFSMVLPKNQINRIYDLRDVVSHTTGFRGKAYNTNRKGLREADVIIITPTRKSYGSLTKENVTKNYFQIDVKTYKRVPVTTDNGSPVLDEAGQPKTTLKQSGTYTKFIDSHITSVKNKGNVGSLGRPSKKIKGNVYNNMAGQEITDMLDDTYQDAVFGDKTVTDQYVKGTVYGTDRILTELPGYSGQ